MPTKERAEAEKRKKAEAERLAAEANNTGDENEEGKDQDNSHSGQETPPVGQSTDESGKEQGTSSPENNENENEGEGKDPAPNHASLRFRKNAAKRLVNLIASVNNTEVEEVDNFYLISAPYIEVNRKEIESVVGELTDARWRMLFVNRAGEVSEFTNDNFRIGIEKSASPAAAAQPELTPISVKIDSLVKQEMDKYRGAEYLDLHQNAFVEAALRDFIEGIKKQIL